MKQRFSAGLLVLLLGGCSSAPDHLPARPGGAARPALLVPDVAACHAFLRQTQRLRFGDDPVVRADDDVFFSRPPYALTAGLAARLPAATPAVPAAVWGEFGRQLRHLDTLALRRFAWQAAQLGPVVLVDSLGQRLAPRAGFEQEIRAWNRSPRAERFVSYASVPLFAAGGRYVLIVRGQSQESQGWDAVLVYERTAQGWKIRAAVPLSTI